MKRLWPLVFLFSCGLARAADVNGAELSLWWGAPFAGILLSIAIAPLVAPKLWHDHYGKIAAAWALAFLVPFGIGFGGESAVASVIHAALAEYIPFIALIAALYVVAGEITACLKAGGNCGSCVPELKRLLVEARVLTEEAA